MANISGIDDEKLGYLVLDIYDYVDRINQVLNQIDEIMLLSDNYFKCESADKIRNHYKELKDNFPILKENIMNCSESLIKVKHQYTNIDSELKKVALQGINKIDIKGGDKHE